MVQRRYWAGRRESGLEAGNKKGQDREREGERSDRRHLWNRNRAQSQLDESDGKFFLEKEEEKKLDSRVWQRMNTVLEGEKDLVFPETEAWRRSEKIVPLSHCDYMCHRWWLDLTSNINAQSVSEEGNNFLPSHCNSIMTTKAHLGPT